MPVHTESPAFDTERPATGCVRQRWRPNAVRRDPDLESRISLKTVVGSDGKILTKFPPGAPLRFIE